MNYWILTKYNFSGISNSEQKYTDFINLLQEFYDYHFDTWNSELSEANVGYTATSLDSLHEQMINVSKSAYIELIEKLFLNKLDLNPNRVLKFKLISDKELIKIFPEHGSE